MDTPDDFIETEIKKILAILDKQCELFQVEKKLKKPEEESTSVEESEPKHVNNR